MCLPNDIQQLTAACLASGDRTAAADLAGRLAAAIAAGKAFGFAGDLAALRRLAGTDGDLGKLAKATSAAALPPPLQDRFERTLAKAEAAETDQERALAKAEVDRLSGDIKAHDAIRRSHALPQRMPLER